MRRETEGGELRLVEEMEVSGKMKVGRSRKSWKDIVKRYSRSQLSTINGATQTRLNTWTSPVSPTLSTALASRRVEKKHTRLYSQHVPEFILPTAPICRNLVVPRITEYWNVLYKIEIDLKWVLYLLKHKKKSRKCRLNI